MLKKTAVKNLYFLENDKLKILIINERKKILTLIFKFKNQGADMRKTGKVFDKEINVKKAGKF